LTKNICAAGTCDISMNKMIAVVTEDGQKVSSHFGMAPLYKVITVEAGKVTGEEIRKKPHHERHPDHHAEHGRHHHHADMFAPIRDCQVLIWGGMGEPAYRKALAAGKEVYFAGSTIQTASQVYLDGEIPSDLRRVHRHL
jgi:predicted Fe-Mo cluster-binding NifX family protein